MALTPEEVVSKTFQPTKFREGYDQDEVDDFLDDVVNTLRALHAENDELKAKLAACESRVGELSRAGAAAASSAPTVEKAPEPAAPPQPEPEPEPVPVAASAPPPMAAAAGGGFAGGGGNGPVGPEAATGMLALAQKLHDEHVRSGEQQRDQLVAEAQERADALVREAEQKKAQTLGALEQERSLLERKIDELRIFERDYRTRLKAYLEGQLKDLEAKGTMIPSRPGEPGHALG